MKKATPGKEWPHTKTGPASPILKSFKHKVMQNALASVLSPSEDELLTQPTTYQGGPAIGLLTPQEVADGCQLYEVRNNMHAPALAQSDYIVVQPLEATTWASISLRSLCLLRVQYPAASDGSWGPFQSHHLARITGNGLRYGGALIGIHDDEGSSLTPIETAACDLVEIHRVTRVIRLLP